IALTGASVTGGATTGTWSIVSSNPAGANTLTNTTLAAGSLTVAANYTGTITLQLASPDPEGPCPAITDTRIINISPAATVEAGEPISVCQSASAQSVALTGASATGGTATWSVVSSNPVNAGITLSNNTLASGSLSVPANYTGSVVVRLSVADPDGAGPCQAVSDERTITIYPGVTVEAGGPNDVCQSANPAPITLTGATIGGGATTGAWSIVSGGGTLSTTAQVANPATVTYTPAPNFTGMVTLRLTTNDPSGPCGANNDTRIINVYPAATLNAGGPYVVPCAINGGVRQVTLAPAFGGGATSVTWSVPAGMGTVVNNVYTPSATALAAGTPVILTAMTNDPAGPCPVVSAQVTVTFAVCNPPQGCTLGYWKNHTDRWCSSYTPNTLYRNVFVNAPAEFYNLTLLQALNLGGGGIYNLARQSVAALLNICSSGANDINYNPAFPTITSLVTAVNTAYRTGGTAPGTLASTLDTYNNAGCPLAGSPATTKAYDKSPTGDDLLAAGSGTELSAYPNPYTNKATIEFTLKEGGDYTLVLHDIRGAVVKSISAGKAESGKKYSFEIGNENMAEGIYLARLSTKKGNTVYRISLRR
ncbi:T9SS type A sorting domain-containing protein, partial [Adhaeribacter rhizoryzae]|uniref:T9SS type A sorting domain-containing protein n=1 Tax=Adhaeribacter rhizoryzae TaxID=2607907 RepID=UPI00167FDEE5